jgi:hypothetical protein
MFVILLIIFFFVSLFAFAKPDIFNRKIFMFYIAVILFFTAGLRPGVADYEVYERLYSYSIKAILVQAEPSFALIAWIVKSTFDNVLFLFIIYAFIGVFLKFKAIKELSLLWGFSILIYVGNFFIRHEMTQIRAGVATGFFLLSIKPLYEKDFKRFIIFTIAASFFHISSLLMLPIWILKNKKLNIFVYALSIPLTYIIVILGFTSVTKIISIIPIGLVQQKYLAYSSDRQKAIAEINIFSIFHVGRCIIYYLLLWKYKLLASKNKYAILLIKIYCLSLISFLLLSNIPDIARRVNEYYGIVEIILFPMLIYIIHQKTFIKITVMLFAFILLLASKFYINLI